MALKNNIAKTQKDPQITEYKVGEESIRLSPAIVRKYLVNGSGNVTDQEIMMFIGLCKYQHLNPFLREAYLIKYGNQAATIVTGKEAITKRKSATVSSLAPKELTAPVFLAMVPSTISVKPQNRYRT